MRSDIGCKRQQNQDNGVALPEHGIFIVADGMGGHQGGEIASQMAVEIIPRQLMQDIKKRSKDLDPKTALVAAVQSANISIYRKSLEENSLRGMGTTTTALFFRGDSLTVGHVGDSRCYYFREKAMWQITRDHSLVEEKMRAGIITRKQAKTDIMRNVITRSVGFEPDVDVEIYDMLTHPGDLFLVCSDGLTTGVEDSVIAKTVQEEFFEKGNLTQTINALVDLANAAGGDDNVTVCLVQVVEGKE